MHEIVGDDWSILPSGDRSIVIVFHDSDLTLANGKASHLAGLLQQASPQGVCAVVPGMASVALHYLPDVVQQQVVESCQPMGMTPYAWLSRQLEIWLRSQSLDSAAAASREVMIPVCYGGEFGPDLAEVASLCDMSEQDVIALHTAHPVKVFALGFAPGHPYIGRFDERLIVGRRSTPRTAVPAGTVGLANRQSVIYPMQLPGGWYLIGRTPLVMFDPWRSNPSCLMTGDSVRFVPIDAQEFERLALLEKNTSEAQA